MSAGSAIEWTDNTWTVTTGCTEASPGCANCYARRMSKRLSAMARKDEESGRNPGKKAAYRLSVLDDGRWSGRVTPNPDALREPLRWRKPQRVFVNSMSDLFWGTEKDLADAKRRGVENPQPVPFDFIDQVFAVMALCPRHTFQVLTKRPERMAEYLQQQNRERVWRQIGAFIPKRAFTRGGSVLPISWSGGFAEDSEFWETGVCPNVWVGTSCEDQKRADERIPHLLQCPAAVRFLSCEPLLGWIDLTQITLVDSPDGDVTLHPLDGVITRDGAGIAEEFRVRKTARIDWVIAGGESGPRARPCNIDWLRSLRDQCSRAGVAFFQKQLGARVDMSFDEWNNLTSGGADGSVNFVLHEPHADRGIWQPNDKKGGDPEEWPEDLRVMQWPEAVA